MIRILIFLTLFLIGTKALGETAAQCIVNNTIQDVCSPAVNVLYHDGKILVSPSICVIYWNSNVNTQIQTQMTTWLSAITDGGYFDGLYEYGLSQRPHLNPMCTNGFTLPNPPNMTTNGCNNTNGTRFDCVTMESIGLYLNTLIGAGTLMKEEFSIYLLFFPSDIITTSGVCATAQSYCGIHQWDNTTSPPYTFSVIPDFSTCTNVGCGNLDFIQNIQSSTSHEIVESITDPFSVDFYTGWADNQWGEIGDMCNQITDVVNGETVQKWWSQLAGYCVTSRPSNFNITTTCDPSTPVNCNNGHCCPINLLCGPGGSCLPPSNCPNTFPVACGTYCCGTGQVCFNSICVVTKDIYGCDTPGYPLDCNNGFCCGENEICGLDGACNVNTTTGVCPADHPVDCNNGFCCPENSICNITGDITTCLVTLNFTCDDPNMPVNCNNGFCCLTDTTCVTRNSVTYCENQSGSICTDPNYPIDCKNGFCCDPGTVCKIIGNGTFCFNSSDTNNGTDTGSGSLNAFIMNGSDRTSVAVLFTILISLLFVFM